MRFLFIFHKYLKSPTLIDIIEQYSIINQKTYKKLNIIQFMKNIKNQLIKLLKKGYCTPQISSLAKTLKVPSATLHYNIKSLEKEGIIKKYSAVLDHKKAGQEFCTFVLISLIPNNYGDPEKEAKELAKYEEVESVDICTGEWELLIKVRTKNMEEYYEFVKKVFSKKGIMKTKSLNSLKQIKSEFI
jgi:Lrp/AsnC family transcriptional regulator, leucine-responsive regulatory protein